MPILKNIFHKHKFEMYPTDRFIEKKVVIEKGIYLCRCGKTDNVEYSTRGELFRNRKLNKND